MIDFSKLATEVFDILRGFGYIQNLYDADRNVVAEPGDARYFFVKSEDIAVSLVDDGENSTLELTKSPRISIQEILGLVEQLRKLAGNYALNWSIKEGDRNIQPQTFGKGGIGESMEVPADLCEGMYGTSKSSYLKLENARLIVKHSDRIDDAAPGARSRRIDRILVENRDGERFLLPTKALLPGRAMVQHLNHGGEFTDAIGQEINRMACDYMDLGKCVRHIRRHGDDLPAEAGRIGEAAREARQGKRRLFERLYRNYDKSASLVEPQTLTEETQEAIRQRIDELKTCLTTEAITLDDAILESLARVTVGPSGKPAVVTKGAVTQEDDEFKNSTIREHLDWLNGFTVEATLLVEDEADDMPDVDADPEDSEAVDEDCELTRDDLILPKNSSPDLKREVVKKSGPQATRDLLVDHDLARMAKLAGLHK